MIRVKLKSCSLGQKFGLQGLVLGALLFSSTFALAQAPLYLPAEIPLDVDTIYQELHPAADYSQTTTSIVEQLRRNHYSEINFDDKFSSTMLDFKI